MTKEEIIKMYEVDSLEEFINSPGKFEGEYIFAPYFYDKYLNGEGEDIYEELYKFSGYSSAESFISAFNVTDEDRREFPGLLDDTDRVRLFETESGFVITERILKEGE